MFLRNIYKDWHWFHETFLLGNIYNFTPKNLFAIQKNEFRIILELRTHHSVFQTRKHSILRSKWNIAFFCAKARKLNYIYYVFTIYDEIKDDSVMHLCKYLLDVPLRMSNQCRIYSLRSLWTALQRILHQGPATSLYGSVYICKVTI